MSSDKSYFVYILSNTSRMLYVGVTNNLERRVSEHKHESLDGFTRQYNLTRLVFYEVYGTPRSAIAREKQIKGWIRSKKVALIKSTNPRWCDLAADWFSQPKPKPQK